MQVCDRSGDLVKERTFVCGRVLACVGDRIYTGATDARVLCLRMRDLPLRAVPEKIASPTDRRQRLSHGRMECYWSKPDSIGSCESEHHRTVTYRSFSQSSAPDNPNTTTIVTQSPHVNIDSFGNVVYHPAATTILCIIRHYPAPHRRTSYQTE